MLAGLSNYDYFARSCDEQGGIVACGAYAFNTGAAFIHQVDAATGKATLKQTILPRTRYTSAYFGARGFQPLSDMPLSDMPCPC